MTEKTADPAAPIAIIGGHGQIALLLARELSSRGRAVRGIIRDPAQADDLVAAGAQPHVCDIETAEADELAQALSGCAAVVFAAGAGPGSGVERKETVDYLGSLKSQQAAADAGVERFVQISFIGAAEPTADGTEEVFAAYWDAKRRADEALRDSPLEWTIVRPGRLLDDGPSGALETAPGTLTRAGQVTQRADTALYIADCIDDPATVREDIAIFTGGA